MGFKKRPETVDTWVGEAPLKSAHSERPWEGFDPSEAPTISFNLRLNRFELAQLRALAAKERRSQQQTAKLILIAALAQRLAELE